VGLAAVPELGRATGVVPTVPAEAAATQDLYERYAGQIFTFCVHQLGNREEAEDATQQTFLNAFRGLRRGIEPEAESAWLYAIAKNVCLTRRRSSWRRGRVETPGDMQALQDFVAAPQRMGTDELIELQEALAGMPATQRKAILLREWRGLSYREIAEEMDLSQAAVETLIFRARRALAKGLEAAPQERRSRLARFRHALDAGSLLGALKALLAGGAAAKAVATGAAAATAVAVVATAPADVPRGPAPERTVPAVVSAPAVPVPADRVVPAAAAVAQRPAPTAVARVRAPAPRRAAPAAVAPAPVHRQAPASANAEMRAPAAPAPSVDVAAPAAAAQASRPAPARAQAEERAAAKEAKAEARTETRAAKADDRAVAKTAKAEPQTAAKDAKAEERAAAKDARADAKAEDRAAREQKAEARPAPAAGPKAATPAPLAAAVVAAPAEVAAAVPAPAVPEAPKGPPATAPGQAKKDK